MQAALQGSQGRAGGVWSLKSGVWEELLNANAIYRKRFDNMFAGIFIISAFMWFPLELQAN